MTVGYCYLFEVHSNNPSRHQEARVTVKRVVHHKDNQKRYKRLKKTPPSWEYERKKNPIPPAERSGGRIPKYDWVTIRNEYVEGILKDDPKDEWDRWWPTYEDLAKRHGAAQTTISARGSRERWRNLKDQQAVEYTKARQRKRADKIANAAIQFDDSALKVGEMGVALIMSRLGEVATEMRMRKDTRADAVERLARGEDVKPKDLRSAVYHQEMLSLANAAEKFQQIGLRALGAPDTGNTTNTLNVNVDASTTNVAQELIRDDKERAGALVAAFAEIGALPAGFIDALGTTDRAEREDLVDAEIVEDPKDVDAEPPTPSEAVPDGEDEEEYELDPTMKALIDNMDTRPSE